jgi:uncharacterized protein (TIGR02118 family)
MTASLFVMYPKPKDTELFDRQYQTEHLPLAGQTLSGVTRVTTHPVVGSPSGPAPYYLITEVCFESMAVLERNAAAEGARRTFAHAAQISTGGPPVFLIARGN